MSGSLAFVDSRCARVVNAHSRRTQTVSSRSSSWGGLLPPTCGASLATEGRHGEVNAIAATLVGSSTTFSLHLNGRSPRSSASYRLHRRVAEFGSNQAQNQPCHDAIAALRLYSE